MPREPPVMSAALPASEIIKPPKSKLEIRKPRPSAVRGCCSRCLHQRAEKRCSKRVALHSFGVPLHSDDPMFVRLVLDSFDHPIGSNRGDAQAMAQIPDGLVVRSIDLDIEPAVTFREARSGCKLGDFASWLDSRGMYGVGRSGRQAFPAVLNLSVQFAGDVLVETAAEADVEALASIANGKNRFSGSEGVQISDLCGEFIWRKLERHVHGLRLGGDGGEVMLKFVRNAVDLFVRSP